MIYSHFYCCGVCKCRWCKLPLLCDNVTCVSYGHILRGRVKSSMASLCKAIISSRDVYSDHCYPPELLWVMDGRTTACFEQLEAVIIMLTCFVRWNSVARALNAASCPRGWRAITALCVCVCVCVCVLSALSDSVFNTQKTRGWRGAIFCSVSVTRTFCPDVHYTHTHTHTHTLNTARDGKTQARSTLKVKPHF